MLYIKIKCKNILYSEFTNVLYDYVRNDSMRLACRIGLRTSHVSYVVECDKSGILLCY